MTPQEYKMTTGLELEKGLTFYYSHEAEFERRKIPVEKQVAIAYEAGDTGRTIRIKPTSFKNI